MKSIGTQLIKALVIAAALVTSVARAATPGIVGSVHDFTINTNAWIAGGTNTWVQRNNVCGVCHTVHHNNADKLAPLWHHTSSSQAFTPYSSASLDATSPGDISGRSRACLSCHDGSVAINDISGTPTGGTAVYIDAGAKINDLDVTHPVSITYDSALVAADGFLNDPNTTTVFGSGGKTISQFMLFNGKLECASCHDIHRVKGNSMNSGILGKVGGTGAPASVLCVTCHKK